MDKAIPAIFASLVFCGCASMLSKSSYTVHITSSEPDAEVRVFKGGEEIATRRTPADLKLSASDGYFKPARYRFEFSKEGFEPAAVDLSATVDPTYMLNLTNIFGLLIGLFVVDPATGAMWRIGETVYVPLRADASSTPDSAIDVAGLLDNGLISTEDASRLNEYLQEKEKSNTRKAK